MLDVDVLAFVVLVLASFRLTHLFVFDSILEPLRRWLRGAPAPGVRAGAGPGPVRRWLSDLVGCYWCTGIWVAMGLLALQRLWPSPVTDGLLLVLAVAGGQALLESLVRR